MNRVASFGIECKCVPQMETSVGNVKALSLSLGDISKIIFTSEMSTSQTSKFVYSLVLRWDLMGGVNNLFDRVASLVDSHFQRS